MANRRDISNEMLDAALGEVPLPAGLLDRLRALADELDSESNADGELQQPALVEASSEALTAEEELLDALIDEQLCDVPLPNDLIARLHATCLEDEAGDLADKCRPGTRSSRRKRQRRRNARFRARPLDEPTNDQQPPRVPPVVAAQAVSPRDAHKRNGHSAIDRKLDAALSQVELPDGFLERLCRLGRQPLRRKTAWMQAAALLIAVGLSYLGVMAALVFNIYPQDEQRPPEMAERAMMAPQVVQLDPVLIHKPQEGPVSVAPEFPRPPELADFSPQPAPLPELDRLDQIAGWTRPALSSEWIFGDTIRGRTDELPEIEMMPTSASRGMDAPHLRGFDWRYFLQNDEWPVVWLHGQVDSRLRSVQVPVQLGTDSYELTRRYVARGELPPSKLIRKEEFLAAGDYPFPAPRGALDMHLSAGPSPFREGGLGLLQVGVQARHLPQSKRPSVHLVAVVDTSNSMSWGGRLALVQQALLEVIGTMQPDDRLSLVAYSDQARIVFQGAGVDEAAGLRQAVDSLTTAHATNMGAGVRHGYLVAASSLSEDRAARRRTRLILLSDGFNELGEAVAARLSNAFEEAEREGIEVSVVDLHQARAATSSTSHLAELLSQDTDDPQVEYYSAASLSETRAAVLEVFTSRQQEVAEAVTIEVTFNHDLVAGYRLIGHEPTSGKLIGLGESAAAADAVLHAGQAATALFELQLREPPQPTKSNPRVDRKTLATVKVTWREPGSRRTRSLVRKINRDQAAETFHEAQPPLQLAALLAETAEVLRNSAHTRRGSLVRVLQLSQEADPTLREQPAYQTFEDLLRSAIDLTPLKSGRP